MVKLNEMQAIMSQCDLDFDGKIQFTEFLIACCNKRLLFSDQNLNECFMHIDKDQDGVIGTKDIRGFVGDEYTDESIKDMIKKADIYSDGTLSPEEFKIIMHKILLASDMGFLF